MNTYYWYALTVLNIFLTLQSVTFNSLYRRHPVKTLNLFVAVRERRKGNLKKNICK